jgi:hypothetical protein
VAPIRSRHRRALTTPIRIEADTYRKALDREQASATHADPSRLPTLDRSSAHSPREKRQGAPVTGFIAAAAPCPHRRLEPCPYPPGCSYASRRVSGSSGPTVVPSSSPAQDRRGRTSFFRTTTRCRRIKSQPRSDSRAPAGFYGGLMRSAENGMIDRRTCRPRPAVEMGSADSDPARDEMTFGFGSQ